MSKFGLILISEAL